MVPQLSAHKAGDSQNVGISGIDGSSDTCFGFSIPLQKPYRPEVVGHGREAHVRAISHLGIGGDFACIFHPAQDNHLIKNAKVSTEETIIDSPSGVDASLWCPDEMMLKSYHNAHLLFAPQLLGDSRKPRSIIA
jgi:hypothetical protein